MTEDRVRDKFSRIYEDHHWGGTSKSGPGSDLDHNAVYLRLLQTLIRDPALNIRSVLDVGCGDWTLGKEIDWRGIDYNGMDIVPSVVAANQAHFGCQTVSFRTGDLAHDVLPPADLLIAKDVLQHLSNDSIATFIPKLTQFRYALLTNDVRCLVSLRGLFGRFLIDTPRANTNIADGDWRPVRLREPPFAIDTSPLAYYEVPFDKGLFRLQFQKEILLWQRKVRPIR